MLLPRDVPVGLWPSMFAVQGPGGRTGRHRHHGIHLILARSGTLSAQVGGVTTVTAGVLTPPDLEHAIDSRGSTVLILFVDPESAAGARLQTALANQPRWFRRQARDDLLRELPDQPDGVELAAWIRVALHHLDAEGRAERRMHPKVHRLLALLADESLEPAPSLASFAERLRLSPSRLMHAFTQSTGTTWRAYLRWLRFQRAAAAMVNGASLTEAAMDGGFHDAPHMTRTFKEMYGITPSALQRPRR